MNPFHPDKAALKPKNPHASALGKLGGSKSTPRKADAARANGAKGGRPWKGDAK